MPKHEQAIFWRIDRRELPVPPVATLLGAEFLAIDPDAGTVEIRFQTKPEFANPVGQVQGGILSAMLDDTLGPALVCTLEAGQFAPTLNLNVNFERPGKIGVPIIGRGRIYRRGREICLLQGELYQDEQRLASATATAMVRIIR